MRPRRGYLLAGVDEANYTEKCDPTPALPKYDMLTFHGYLNFDVVFGEGAPQGREGSSHAVLGNHSAYQNDD